MASQESKSPEPQRFSDAPPLPKARQPGWVVPACAGLIVLAALGAYHNSFSGTFLLDDIPAILDNPTIERLWPISEALRPPSGGYTVSGRPLLNLSLAIDYALYRTEPEGLDAAIPAGETSIFMAGPKGFHITNLVIHILTALTLFGLIRRTLLLDGVSHRWADSAAPVALAAGLLWTVHPLQTESVTYIIQRAESIVALFYLLTLYCVVRGVTGRRALPWYTAAVAACLLGMASKEVMVSAPLIVLLYDRTFLAGTFREALRRRRRLYGSLAATWALLTWLVVSSGGRGDTAGFEAGMSPWAYAGTQVGAIVRYLRLTVWPSDLTFDYGIGLAEGVGEILPPAVLVAALVGATVVALRFAPRLGFLGVAFFALLAPSSSIVPVATQTMAEHRMYLPLACVVVLAVLAACALLDRLRVRRLLRWALPAMILAAVTGALGWRTVVRNEDYGSQMAMWQDTVAKRPDSERAHYNLGKMLCAQGRMDEGAARFREAVRLNPDYTDAQYDLGRSLLNLGQFDQALTPFRQTVRLDPSSPYAHSNLGAALTGLGRLDEAAASYRAAAALDADHVEAHIGLATALTDLGRPDKAIVHGEKAVQLAPNDVNARNSLARALQARGRLREAVAQYEQALRLAPESPELHTNLGAALHGLRRFQDAAGHHKEALRLRPDFLPARINLAAVLYDMRRYEEALTHYEALLRLDPGNAFFQRRVAELKRLPSPPPGSGRPEDDSHKDTSIPRSR